MAVALICHPSYYIGSSSASSSRAVLGQATVAGFHVAQDTHPLPESGIDEQTLEIRAIEVTSSIGDAPMPRCDCGSECSCRDPAAQERQDVET